MATNKTSSAYTAIPWTVKRFFPPGDFSRYEVWSATDRVATLEIRGADQDNAEFIVRACNSHHELLDAARGLYDLITELQEDGCDLFDDDRPLLEHCYAVLHQHENP